MNRSNYKIGFSGSAALGLSGAEGSPGRTLQEHLPRMPRNLLRAARDNMSVGDERQLARAAQRGDPVAFAALVTPALWGALTRFRLQIGGVERD